MSENQILNTVRIDREAFSICSLEDDSDEKEYWLSKSPIDRIYSVEILRQIMYGYDPLTARLQRFFEVTELS
jgi:hypothetical protein